MTVEHILLSIAVTSDETSAGPFDDSCASILERELMKYQGVKRVRPDVLYRHSHIEHHLEPCHCYFCDLKN